MVRSMKNNEQFRLTIYPVLDHMRDKCLMFFFDTIEEVDAAEMACAEMLLFLQDTAQVMKDHSNSFLIEEWDGEEWFDPYS